MEKSLRVLGGEDAGGAHSHSHSHGPESTAAAASAVSTSVSKDGLRARSGPKSLTAADADAKALEEPEATAKQPMQPSKLSAYLNLFGDFVHNM